MDAIATDSGSIESGAGHSLANRFHNATMEFDRVWRAASCRDQLLTEVGTNLLRLSNAGIAIHVALDSNQPARQPELLPGSESPSSDLRVHPTEPAGQPEIRVLASRFPNLSANLEQWAATIGLRSIATQRPCFDSVTDANHQLLRLISIPCKGEKPDNESLSALFVGGSDDGFAETTFLQLAVLTIERWEANQQTKWVHQLALDTAALNEIGSTIENFQSSKACCQQIANRLHEYIARIQNQQDQLLSNGLEIFVALADGSCQPKLTSISHADALPNDPGLTESVEAAISECVCRQNNTVWPPEKNDRHALLCHRRLTEQFCRPNLVTVPLRDGAGKLQAAVMVASQHVLTARTRRFCFSFADSLGSTLALVKRAEQNRVQRFLSRTSESLRTQKAKIALKSAGVIFLIGLIPLPYRISTDCEVQPATRRFVCSPFESQLKHCLVEPGDIVTANEIVARLDEREIRMELSEVEAEFHRASRELDGFVASHESGEARLAQLETEKLQARNQLLTHRTNNLELRSPIDGMVISGDLKKAEGMPLETGQTLFEIAPLQQLVIELLIPEDDIRYLETGLNACIRLDAFPFESWHGTVDRIHPASEIRNDDNVFVATVLLDNHSGRLRPGMQGSAKITSVWRPISWNWLHKPVARCLRWLGW